MKVRLKDKIEKLDAMERTQGAASESSSHPRPFPERILKTEKPNFKVMKTELEAIFLHEIKTVCEELGTAWKFEDPNAQTISAKQVQAFNDEIAEDESSYHENFNSPYVMSIQEQRISTNSKLYWLILLGTMQKHRCPLLQPSKLRN